VGLPFLKCPALTWPLVTLHLGVGFITFEVRESIYYVHEGAMMQTSAFFFSFFVLVGIQRRARLLLSTIKMVTNIFLKYNLIKTYFILSFISQIMKIMRK
jgi:hypothetical protein